MLNNFYRFISALMGGMFGTFFMFLIYGMSIFLLGNKENPITSFILIFMIFLGSLTSNLMCGVLFSLSAPDKYTERSHMLWHAFLINLFLFFVAFPFYILIAHTFFVAIIHILLSTFASSLVYEFFTEKGSYALTGLYSSLFTLFILSMSFLLLQNSSISSLFLFAILPFVWSITVFITLITEAVYTQFYHIFGIAVLDPKFKI